MPPPFPPLHTLDPTTTHTHTVILVHGLGSSGPSFRGAFFSARSTHDFRALFPGTRWVFPSAPRRYVPAHQQTKPAWFAIASLRDLEDEQELQMAGLRESVAYLGGVVHDEVERVEARNVFVLGRSQGSSAVVWAVVARGLRVGGLVLTGSWLVFARALEERLKMEVGPGGGDGEVAGEREAARKFVGDMVDDVGLGAAHALRQVPVLIGHGVDDEWISVGLGRQMRDVLRGLGCEVMWNEYCGASEEGHWLKEPEEFDNIALFLTKCMTRNEDDHKDSSS